MTGNALYSKRNSHGSHHRLVRPHLQRRRRAAGRQQLFARQGRCRSASPRTAARRPRHRGKRTRGERQWSAAGPPGRAARLREARRRASIAPPETRDAQASSPRTAEIQRVVDLICPLGFGQRALIVSPPKAGKTVMLQAVAEGVALNHPSAILLILLVDERPEEVSEMVDWGRGEVIASSFDLSHERHVAVADMVFEHARRQVELGKDVVIVLDSLTRLARSHNTTGRGSGRTMSGGLDANALAKPKGLFGAARAVPEGGSLTVIATALVETESRMDDVIFEEFKGTGNAELRLSRALADRRLYPAVDVAASGTRREELLADPATVAAKQQLRRGLVGLPPEKAIDVLLAQLRRAKTNAELLAAVS